MFKNLSFNITHKILLLVGILSALAALTTLHSLNSMHTVNKNYRYLLENKTQNTLIIGEALVDLSDASRIAFSVLTEQEERQMRLSQNELLTQQLNFIDKLESIRALSKPQAIALEKINIQQARAFGLINEVIEQAARWRGDRALIIIHRQLEPELSALRLNMDELRQSIVDDHLTASQQLADTTQDTIINTALAVAFILILALSLASFLSYANISRPITRLTQVMSRLTDRQYDDPIGYQQRNDEIGHMAQALDVFRDTMQRADRLEIEAARSTENKRLSEQLVALTDAMPGAVFQLRVKQDGSRDFLFLSSKAEYFLEQPVDSLLNQTFDSNQSIFPGSSTFQWIINKAFTASRQTLAPIDTDIRVEHGRQLRWYKILASCKRLDDSATLFNGVLLDVTDSKNQAQALEEAKNTAEQAARAQATFLNTMSHEIRTPMNAILGLTQLALRNELNNVQQQRLEKISSAGQHLLNIINDILDFSKIDGNHLELEHIPFEPAKLIANTVEMLADDAHKKGLQLHIELDPKLPRYLTGDATRIGQILLNYLHNAIKFSDSGAIYIRAQLKQINQTEIQFYCEVEDQGIGISEQNIQHLFKEFKQADASITRRFGGTGLGLAISRKLAQLMEGDVGVRSKEGHGSTFWFSVAINSYNAPIKTLTTHTESKPTTPPNWFQGLRILLVDDNELNRIVGQEILEQAGFIVEFAVDGQHAVDCIARADQQYYSAVLMDIMMPILDGISATKKIRRLKQGQNLPIIALSAHVSTEHSEGYAEAGMNAYISKPINQQSLWQTLEQHIKRPLLTTSSNILLAESAFEQKTLQSMHNNMGDKRFLVFLIKLNQDYQTRLVSISQLDTAKDTAEIQQNLHDLISTAGHAGFHQLSQLASELNNALKSQHKPLIIELQANIQQTLHMTIAYLDQQIQALQS